jgi:hypothetical protein
MFSPVIHAPCVFLSCAGHASPAMPQGHLQGRHQQGRDMYQCPTKGITTAGMASASATACDRATPGYRPLRPANSSATSVLGVEACPVGTYGPDGLRCIACTNNLTTQATASTNTADCLAAPGYGFYAKAEGDNRPVSTADLQAASTRVIKCPSGSFKVNKQRRGVLTVHASAACCAHV